MDGFERFTSAIDGFKKATAESQRNFKFCHFKVVGLLFQSAVVLVLGVGLIGCPDKHESHETSDFGTPKRRAKPAAKSVGCVTQDDAAIAPGAVVQRQTVTVTRAFQRVKRTGCNGEVISDKEETVKEPQTRITLRPVGEIRGIRYVQDSIYNRTTCGDRNQVIGTLFGSVWRQGLADLLGKDPEIKSVFEINTSPEWVGSLHVLRTRENYIDYRYYTCNGVEARCKPEAEDVLESGTLILTVNYSEEHLDGVREVDACTRDADGKPVDIK